MEDLTKQEIEIISGGKGDKERDSLDAAAQLIGGAIAGVAGFIAALF